MGTRGTFGFRSGGKDKLMYNHFDSYPDGLGANILHDIKKIIKHKGLGWIAERASKLKLIDDTKPPTVDDIFALRQWTDLSVSHQSVQDWYCITRKLQGDITAVLESGYIYHNADFINESLFCEWGYIVNLDDNVLEVYKGFQHHPHKMGRYSSYKPPEKWPNGSKNDNPYYACALIATFPLNKLPKPSVFTKTIERACEKLSKEREEIEAKTA